MSISPAQFAIAPATVEPPARTPAAGSKPDPQTPGKREPVAPAEPSGSTMSTDLRIDDQRRIYYEIVNNRTGDVVMELPPEQIRRLAEDSSESQAGRNISHNIDVKA